MGLGMQKKKGVLIGIFARPNAEESPGLSLDPVSNVVLRSREGVVFFDPRRELFFELDLYEKCWQK